MPRHSFKCMDCESYILSNSHSDGCHCPGCGGPISPIPYAELNFKKKNVIKPDEHDLVIVCDGPREIKVFKDGIKLDKLTGVEFKIDMHTFPEIKLTQAIIKNNAKKL